MGNSISHGLDAEGSRHVTSVRFGDATSKGGGSAAEGSFGSDVACLAPCAAVVEGDTVVTTEDSSAAHGLGQGAAAGSVSSVAGCSAGLLASASAVCLSSGVVAQSGQGMAVSSTSPTGACPEGEKTQPSLIRGRLHEESQRPWALSPSRPSEPSRDFSRSRSPPQAPPAARGLASPPARPRSGGKEAHRAGKTSNGQIWRR